MYTAIQCCVNENKVPFVSLIILDNMFKIKENLIEYMSYGIA